MGLVVGEIVAAHIDELAVGFVFGIEENQAIPEDDEGGGQEEGKGPADDSSRSGGDEDDDHGEADDRDEPAEGADVVKDGLEGGLASGVLDEGILRETESWHCLLLLFL